MVVFLYYENICSRQRAAQRAHTEMTVTCSASKGNAPVIEKLTLSEANSAAEQRDVMGGDGVSETPNRAGQMGKPAAEADATLISNGDESWSLGSVVKEALQVIVPAIFLALAIHIFLAQATIVYGQSMQPNLQPAERLVIEKFSYYFEEPQRNDIVVLDMPQMSELLIKRVVALPGEQVEIRRGTVLINGQAITQPFVQIQGGATYGPITLGPGSYFVMGDNRGNSNDSRVFGPVSRNVIAGRAWIRYWPVNRFAVFK